MVFSFDKVGEVFETVGEGGSSSSNTAFLMDTGGEDNGESRGAEVGTRGSEVGSELGGGSSSSNIAFSFDG